MVLWNLTDPHDFTHNSLQDLIQRYLPAYHISHTSSPPLITHHSIVPDVYNMPLWYVPTPHPQHMNDIWDNITHNIWPWYLGHYQLPCAVELFVTFLLQGPHNTLQRTHNLLGPNSI